MPNPRHKGFQTCLAILVAGSTVMVRVFLILLCLIIIQLLCVTFQAITAQLVIIKFSIEVTGTGLEDPDLILLLQNRDLSELIRRFIKQVDSIMVSCLYISLICKKKNTFLLLHLHSFFLFLLGPDFYVPRPSKFSLFFELPLQKVHFMTFCNSPQRCHYHNFEFRSSFICFRVHNQLTATENIVGKETHNVPTTYGYGEDFKLFCLFMQLFVEFSEAFLSTIRQQTRIKTNHPKIAALWPKDYKKYCVSRPVNSRNKISLAAHKAIKLIRSLISNLLLLLPRGDPCYLLTYVNCEENIQ